MRVAKADNQQWASMHPDLARQADAVIERQHKRPCVPPFAHDKDFAFVPPYRSDRDKDRWWALFFDALGTRQVSVVTMFIRQLESLVDQRWRDDWQQWTADEEQMIAGFALIQSLKPRNIAEAALAAQLYALHLTNMKLARGANRYQDGDARTTATLARSIRAYGDGLMTMRRLKGKGGRSVQIIKVQTHRHDHQHIHLEGGSINGGRVHAKAAGAIAELRSLSRESADGEAVSIPCREGQACLPDARRGKGNGRAKGSG